MKVYKRGDFNVTGIEFWSGDLHLKHCPYCGAKIDGESLAAATPNIDKLVDKFLAWQLPKDFAPDCGISFDGRTDDEWNKNKTWPVGTNLFTADQARQMLEHLFRA